MIVINAEEEILKKLSGNISFFIKNFSVMIL